MHGCIILSEDIKNITVQFWALLYNREPSWYMPIVKLLDLKPGVFSRTARFGKQSDFQTLALLVPLSHWSLGITHWSSDNPGFYQLNMQKQIRLQREIWIPRRSGQSVSVKSATFKFSFQFIFSQLVWLVALCPKKNNRKRHPTFPQSLCFWTSHQH